jgi:glucan phosphoethanolaminetransferase (alkaline phosphatase superfamily)
MVVHCYTTNFSIKKSSYDDANPLKYFIAFHASAVFYNIFCFYYVLYVIRRLLRTLIGVLFNPSQ